MEYENIDWQIIEKSFREDLSQEEQESLNRWLEASEQHRVFYNNALFGGPTNPLKGLDAGLLKEKKEVLFKRIEPEHNRRGKWIVRWSGYAALMVLFVGIALFYSIKREPISPENIQPTIVQLPPLPPGGNKAVLTLSDGRQVVLDSMKGNIIAEDSGQIQNQNHTLIYAGNRSSTPVYHTISIPRGGEYHLLLSDSTEVWINSCTEIRYPVAFSDSVRGIWLNGEAYFEVKKDRRPFKVFVNDLEVKVYGTSFNINAYQKNRIEATLVEGRISLCRTNDRKEILLKPAEQACYYTDRDSINIQAVNVYDFVAWKQGEFVFNDQTIEEMMQRLSMWYDVEVKYADPSVKKRKFTGVMQRYETIDKLLYYIQETATIKFRAQGREITVE